MSTITIQVDEGTDPETCALVKRAVEGAIAARDASWVDVVQQVAQTVAESVNSYYATGRRPATRRTPSATDIAADVVRQALPEVLAAVNAPKVQRIEHDDAGRIVAITTTAA